MRTILNAGSGPRNLVGAATPTDFLDTAKWETINLDIDALMEPDIIASITNMKGVKKNSVDVVWSSHVLEHLYEPDVPKALKEFYRVIKPEGCVIITVPDLQRVAEYIIKDGLDATMFTSVAGKIKPLDCIFGLRKSVNNGHKEMEHHTGFTGKSLRQYVKNAGFTKVEVRRSKFDLWVRGIK